MKGLPVEEMKSVGYAIAFKGKYAFLYDTNTDYKCVRVEASTGKDLKSNKLTFEACMLPDNAYIELWHNGIKMARHSVKMIESDYGTLAAWKLVKEAESGVEFTFSLDLSGMSDVAGKPLRIIPINQRRG